MRAKPRVFRTSFLGGTIAEAFERMGDPLPVMKATKLTAANACKDKSRWWPASRGGSGTGSPIPRGRGASVAICARTVRRLPDTLAQIEAVGGNGVMFECDLADPSGGRDTRTEEALAPASAARRYAHRHPAHVLFINDVNRLEAARHMTARTQTTAERWCTHELTRLSTSPGARQR